MSTTVRTLRAVLTADTGDFTSGLNKAERSIESIATAVKGFLTLAAAKQAFDFIAASVKEFAAAEQGVVKFRSAVSSLTRDVEKSTLRATEFATALSRRTLFTDDSILAAQTLLTSIGRLTGEGLERATKAAADLATGLGVDLESAAQMLAKAAQGSTAALNRLGIEGETFEGILRSVETRFSGVSQAAAQTAQGGLTQLSKEFGELQEQIGGAAANSGLISLLNQMTDALRKLNDEAAKGNIKGIFGDALNVLGIPDIANTPGELDFNKTKERFRALAAMRAIGATGYETNYTGGNNPRAADYPFAPTTAPGATAAPEQMNKIIADSVEAMTKWSSRYIEMEADLYASSQEWANSRIELVNSEAEAKSYGAWQYSSDYIEAEAEATAAAAQAAAQRMAIAEREKQQKIAAAGAILGASSGFLRTAFEGSKSAAMAAAAIDTAAAVLNVWAHWAWNPPVAGALTAIAIATGMAQMAQIRNTNIQGYAQGGIIPGIDTGRDSVPIMARPGEAVLPKELTDMLLASGGGVEIHLHGSLPALVTELNRETKRGNLRLVANALATSGLVR